MTLNYPIVRRVLVHGTLSQNHPGSGRKVLSLAVGWGEPRTSTHGCLKQLQDLHLGSGEPSKHVKGL